MKQRYQNWFHLTLVLLLTTAWSHTCLAETGARQSIFLSGNLLNPTLNQVLVSDIETINLSSLSIYDPFEKKHLQYSGVLLGQFVQYYGGKGVSSVTFTAIDDYEITFTANEWAAGKIMLVTRVDGRHIDFDQKGPVRIVYTDYDKTRYNAKENMPRWIWMITSVKFQ